METVIHILAYILAMSVIFFLTTLGLESVLQAYSDYIWKKNYELKKLGKIELARQIGLYSYYLSESPEIHRAIIKLSQNILSSDDAIFNAEKYRDSLNENN